MPGSTSKNTEPAFGARLSFTPSLQFFLHPLEFLTQLERRQGPVARFRFLGQESVLISDPELIRQALSTQHASFEKGRFLKRAKILLGEGLLTAEGEAHVRHRKLMQPAFYQDRLRQYAAVMVELTARRMAEWHQRFRPHSPVDIHAEMVKLTQAIVAKTLYSADVGGESAELTEAIERLVRTSYLLRIPGGEHIGRWPLVGARLRADRDRLEAAMYALIAQRRTSQADHGDLLSMLLVKDPEGGNVFTDTQVRDELMTLFLAGHETTANALTWTWYLLAQNPDATLRLGQELRSVLGGRLPGPDDADRLPFTRAVLAESMRLLPPVWVVARMARVPVQLGALSLPAGTVCFFSQWVMHRKPELWPEPEAFRPQRWLDTADRPKLAYFPFGAGPRVCLGERFAWIEGVLLLAAIAQHWEFALAPGRRVSYLPSIVLRPRHGLWCLPRRIMVGSSPLA